MRFHAQVDEAHAEEPGLRTPRDFHRHHVARLPAGHIGGDQVQFPQTVGQHRGIEHAELTLDVGAAARKDGPVGQQIQVGRTGLRGEQPLAIIA